jgi:hypothetical protein
MAVVAILGLATWIIKRRHEATPEQRAEDREAELLRLNAEIVACRRDNDDAGAESRLRRVRELSDPEYNPARSPSRAAWERGVDDPAGGNPDQPAG